MKECKIKENKPTIMLKSFKVKKSGTLDPSFSDAVDRHINYQWTQLDCNVNVFETFVVARPRENTKPAFSKIFPLKSAFEEKYRFYVWTEGRNAGKNLRFQKYPDTYEP